MAAPNTKVGAAEIGGNVRERGLLCFVQSSVLQVSPLTISAGLSLFLCALGLKLWRTLNSQWREAVIWGALICSTGASWNKALNVSKYKREEKLTKKRERWK